MLFLNPQLNGEIGSQSRVELDGVEYRLDLLWLAREPNTPWIEPGPPDLTFEPPGVWSCSLRAEDGTLLLAGQVLRHGADILAGMTSIPGLPPGRLQAWDESGAARDPGRADLDEGSPVRLIYRTAAEVGR